MIHSNVATLALQIVAGIYAEEMRLAVAYVSTGQPVDAQTAREHFRRAEAAHFMAGLLFDAAETAPATEDVDATPIRVEEGSASLRDADPATAALVDNVKPITPDLDAEGQREAPEAKGSMEDDEGGPACPHVPACASESFCPFRDIAKRVEAGQFKANADEANHPVLMNDPPSR